MVLLKLIIQRLEDLPSPHYCLFKGEAVPDLNGIVGTTSIRVEWGELSFLAQAELQSFELQIRREGRADPVVERSLSFFIRAFTSTEVSPGLPYEVHIIGIYSGGVLGLPSIVRLTTLEEGEKACVCHVTGPCDVGAYQLHCYLHSTFWFTFEP